MIVSYYGFLIKNYGFLIKNRAFACSRGIRASTAIKTFIVLDILSCLVSIVRPTMVEPGKKFQSKGSQKTGKCCFDIVFYK